MHNNSWPMNNPKLPKMASVFETWMFSFARKNCAFIVCYHFHCHTKTKCFLKYSIVFVHTFKMYANGTVDLAHLRVCNWERENQKLEWKKKASTAHPVYLIGEHCFKISLLAALLTFVSSHECDEIVRLHAINEIQWNSKLHRCYVARSIQFQSYQNPLFNFVNHHHQYVRVNSDVDDFLTLVGKKSLSTFVWTVWMDVQMKSSKCFFPNSNMKWKWLFESIA